MTAVTEVNQSELPAFGSNFSPKAAEARGGLPPELQVEIISIVDQLTDDPEMSAHPHRVESSGNGEIFIYRHPQPRIELTYEIVRDRNLLYFIDVNARSIEVGKELFISYSHEDSDWLKKLKKFLKPLENADKIRIWDDNEIKPGDKWEQEIERSLKSSRAAVLLVTQDFLTSKFINENELPRLLMGANQEGKKIFWIAISYSTYHDTDLQNFQSVNDPETPLDTLDLPTQNKEFVKIYDLIKNAIE